MKNLWIILTFIISSASIAGNTFTAKVEEAFCGEMDPFIIGDVCVVNLIKDNGDKLAVVVDFDQFTLAYTEGELDNKKVEVDSSRLSYITDRDQLGVLRDFDADYFYMFGEVNSFNILNDSYEMEEFIAQMSGDFSIRNLPAGYTAKKLSTGVMNSNLKSYLKSLTKKKKEDWKYHVLESCEYDNLPLSEVKKILANPEKELQVKYLLEVEEVIAIYKGNKLIGYFMEVSDHVQAAIYQDGAWIDLLLDANQKVIKATDQSA